MKIVKLSDRALDWAVLQIEKEGAERDFHERLMRERPVTYPYRPSTDWTIGGAIINRECISVKFEVISPRLVEVHAEIRPDYDQPCIASAIGPDVLTAAMRCWVNKHYDKGIDVPRELLREVTFT